MDQQLLAAAKELRIGVGFDKAWKSGWYIRVNGKKNYFNSEEAQEAALSEKISEIRLMGVGALDVTTAERQAIIAMRERANAAGLTPLEIFERGCNGLSVTPKVMISVFDCSEKFISAYEYRYKNKEISIERWYDIRRISRRFAAYSRGLAMDSVSADHVEHYMRSLGTGLQTQRTHALIIRRLFNWSREKGYSSNQPVPKLRPIRHVPVVWPPDMVRNYFKAILKHAPGIAPMMALRWFGGIRPKATTLMRWEDINFPEKRVSIRHDINKLRQPDVIEGLPDQFWKWMRHYRKDSGRIAHQNHRKITARLHTDLGYSKKKNRWPEDVARHSFASHSLPLDGIEKTKSMMLHRLAETTLKHYLVLNVSRRQARDYRSILPGGFIKS